MTLYYNEKLNLAQFRRGDLLSLVFLIGLATGYSMDHSDGKSCFV